MASVSEETNAPTVSDTTSTRSPPSPEFVYRSISSYPFHSDEEYQAGLAAILGHPDIPTKAEELQGKEELIQQAQCFYFSRKFNIPVDIHAYRKWLSSQSSSQAVQAENPMPTTLPPTAESLAPDASEPEPSPPPAQAQEPPYPTTFAHIVDLITRNIPVPGIEEIPATVLEPGSSKVDNTPRRRKPWEKDNVEQTEEEDSAINTEAGVKVADKGQENEPIDINGHRETGVGVVRMLQPNAVARSGLLARD